MHRSRRLSRLVLGGVLAAGLALSACGDRAADVPSEPLGELAPAQLDGIADPEILALIVQLFPPGELRRLALVHYSQIRVWAVLEGDRDAAIAQAFEFLRFTLRLLRAGRLLPPDPVAPEVAVDLFVLVFVELGFEGPPLSPENLEEDFAMGLIGPEGGRVTVPSKHAAIAFDPGMLTGPTWVVVAGLPDPEEPGMCPYDFPVPNDCYPLFFDYSIFPEENLAGVPRIGQCVVEFGPFAPPSEEVEARLRIASESEDVPGTLVFWPLTTPPTTVDCTDLETQVLGWQGAVWDALGPLAGLFRVTPAFADPGRLGASITSFSPFAPADPVVDEQNGEIQG